MSRYEVNIVSSGSWGNAVIIDGVILMDCGITASHLLPFINQLSAIFITHKHSDHLNCSFLFQAAKQRPSLISHGLYTNRQTHNAIASAKQQLAASIKTPVMDRTPFILNTTEHSYEVHPWRAHHDVECTGYSFIRDDGETLVYSTDTTSIAQMPDISYDCVALEGNWDEQTVLRDLQSTDKSTRYRANRNLRHLSIQSFEKFVLKNAETKPAADVYQLHISRQYGYVSPLAKGVASDYQSDIA